MRIALDDFYATVIGLDATDTVKTDLDTLVMCRTVTGLDDADMVQTCLDILIEWQHNLQMDFSNNNCYLLHVAY